MCTAGDPPATTLPRTASPSSPSPLHLLFVFPLPSPTDVSFPALSLCRPPSLLPLPTRNVPPCASFESEVIENSHLEGIDLETLEDLAAEQMVQEFLDSKTESREIYSEDLLQNIVEPTDDIPPDFTSVSDTSCPARPPHPPEPTRPSTVPTQTTSRSPHPTHATHPAWSTQQHPPPPPSPPPPPTAPPPTFPSPLLRLPTPPPSAPPPPPPTQSSPPTPPTLSAHVHAPLPPPPPTAELLHVGIALLSGKQDGYHMALPGMPPYPGEGGQQPPFSQEQQPLPGKGILRNMLLRKEWTAEEDSFIKCDSPSHHHYPFPQPVVSCCCSLPSLSVSTPLFSRLSCPLPSSPSPSSPLPPCPLACNVSGASPLPLLFSPSPSSPHPLSSHTHNL